MYHPKDRCRRRKMGLHITLVNPPYPSGSHQHPPFTPLGLGYLAAILEKNHYTVDVIDCQAIGWTYEQVRKEVDKRRPDVVGVTSTTLTYKSALRVAELAKEVCPNCLTLLGGSHATFWDDNALRECPSLDVVVRKEGEYTMLDLLERVKTGKDYRYVLGTTSRKDGEIIKNPDRAYIENLDELPFPAPHLWPIDQLRKYGSVVFPIIASRGCVYWCDFCTTVRMFGRRYRMRSPKNLVDEIEQIHKKYGQSQFTFYDDAFTVDPKRVVQICDEIQRRKLAVQWDCETRVDMVNRELLQKMRDAGCMATWFGVESGSPSVLEKMHKKIKLDQTRDRKSTRLN